MNIESNYEEISKDIGVKPEEESLAKSRISEDDVSAFCIWMKEDLKETIAKVTISKRLTATPAILTGKMSSSMQVMMKMMEQSG